MIWNWDEINVLMLLLGEICFSVFCEIWIWCASVMYAAQTELTKYYKWNGEWITRNILHTIINHLTKHYYYCATLSPSTFFISVGSILGREFGKEHLQIRWTSSFVRLEFLASNWVRMVSIRFASSWLGVILYGLRFRDSIPRED